MFSQNEITNVKILNIFCTNSAPLGLQRISVIVERLFSKLPMMSWYIEYFKTQDISVCETTKRYPT